MDADQLARALEQEGFRHTYVWEDAPNASYLDHTHATETAHIILSGEMAVAMGGVGRTIAPASAAMCRLVPCIPRAWDRVGAAT